MADEKRRVLTTNEKSELLSKHKVCYICLEPLDGYETDEIEFDHIYNYADGYPQELSNFAPVHASSDSRKLNCHAAKGRKSPFEYREELRIKKKLNVVKGLKDLCPKAVSSTYSLSSDHKIITFNSEELPLYNQRINGKDNFYFFHEVDTKYIKPVA
jgi:hypothetical protein